MCVLLQDGIIAAKRIDMSKKGVETCGDVDEVRLRLHGSCRCGMLRHGILRNAEAVAVLPCVR